MKSSSLVIVFALAASAFAAPAYADTYQQYFDNCMQAQHEIMDRALNTPEYNIATLAREALALDSSHSEDRRACEEAATRAVNGTAW